MGKKLINSEVKLGENTLLLEAIATAIPFAHGSLGNVNNKSMNNIKTTGLYYGYNMTNSAETTISTFLVMAYSNDWITQLQFVMSNAYTRVFIRRFHSGNTWSAWERLF